MVPPPAHTQQVLPLPELARDVARGHAEMDLLLQRCRPIVFAVVLDRVHNPELSEDLTQEALTAVAQALPGLREPRAFYAWLRQIAVNRCKMWWRRPRPELEPLDEDWRRLVYEDAYAEAARRETWRELRRGLQDLPEASRLALLMHVCGNVSQAEIAEVLGTTPASVAVRIHRARQRLRASLQPLPLQHKEECPDVH